jgi:hypothetical protein
MRRSTLRMGFELARVEVVQARITRLQQPQPPSSHGVFQNVRRMWWRSREAPVAR